MLVLLMIMLLLSLFLSHAFKLTSTHFLNEIIHMSWIVSLLSKNISTSSNLFEKRISLFAFTSFNTFLNNIVSITILHHLVERTIHSLRSSLLSGIIVLVFIVIFHYFINDFLLIFITSILHTLFDYITCKFMIT